MKYLPLLDLSLTHTYYSDGRCPDFRVTPTAATLNLLKNHRCILRFQPNGVQVLCPVTGDGEQFIPVSAGAVFAFVLYVNNPGFPWFTDLSEHARVAAPLLTNADLGEAEPVQLALTSRRAMSTESFAVQRPANEERFVLSGYPSPETQARDMAVAGLTGVPSVSGYDAPSKHITVDSLAASEGSGFSVMYQTIPKQPWGIFAEVEIHSSDSWPEILVGPARFEIAFTAKRARWSYYVVTDRGDAQFQIQDREEPPLVFSSQNRRDLSQEPDLADDVAKSLAEQYPDLRRIRFVSDESVPCSDRSRKSIQLRMDGDLVGGILPNPSPRNYSMVDVLGNGELQKEESLFQIVKFLSN